MNAADFKTLAKDVVDYIVDYTENIRERAVLPSVQPGYLHSLLPAEAPEEGDDWRQVLPDIERLIMPGITHWNSPMFNAYYPAGNSYPSIIGDLLSAGIGCVGFNWLTSPACTELEVVVLDWLAKLMGLPECFLASSCGPGGGVIQSSGSEGIFLALLIAKERKSRQLQAEAPPDSPDPGLLKSKLVAYSSDQSNSAIEKAGLLGSMQTRLLASDSAGRLTRETLEEAIRRDRAAGLIPAFLVATLGTTGTCAFDCLSELGPLCAREGIWLHVDAAYAGAAFICPEYRQLMAGIEWADSINMNPHKWLLVNFDCSVFWIKERRDLVESFSVERIYLRGVRPEQGQAEAGSDNWAPEYRNWEIPLGRRFRALKLWLTLRLYGRRGLQDFLRGQIGLAKLFESHVKGDPRFELVVPASMGLVCFRLKGEAGLTRELLERLTASRELYLNQSVFRGCYFLRYAVCSRLMTESDVETAWSLVSSQAGQILSAVLQQSAQLTSQSLLNSSKSQLTWESNLQEELLISRS